VETRHFDSLFKLQPQ